MGNGSEPLSGPPGSEARVEVATSSAVVVAEATMSRVVDSVLSMVMSRWCAMRRMRERESEIFAARPALNSRVLPGCGASQRHRLFWWQNSGRVRIVVAKHACMHAFMQVTGE